MTFTHALSTNNYGPAKFIVDANAANGTHTTIAAALTSASSGDTIFIRPGTYTEALTLKAGVNLSAYGCDASFTGSSNVIITGTTNNVALTYTTAGTVNIYGIQIQTNGNFALAVTGSAASVINLRDCYLNCSTTTGISFTAANTAAHITLTNCCGDLGTTAIAFVVSSSTGAIDFFGSSSIYSNSGASTLANSCSAGQIRMGGPSFANPFTSTSTGSFQINQSIINTSAQNVTCLTHGGNVLANVRFTNFFGGSASAISVGGSMTVENIMVSSTNTNAITGAGTLNYSVINYENTSNLVNTTTQSGIYTDLGKYKARSQPAFLVFSENASNVTGDATVYTMTWPTEIFDQNSNFASNTFTAPVTGQYLITSQCAMSGLLSTHTIGLYNMVTSNRTYQFRGDSAAANRSSVGTNNYGGAALCDMDAGDTATVQLDVRNGTKVVNVSVASYFSGNLAC